MTRDSDNVESAKEVTETGMAVDLRSGQWVGAERSQHRALTEKEMERTWKCMSLIPALWISVNLKPVRAT